EFAAELLKELKENMINTAIETCGYGKTEILKKILIYTDTVFFDLKITDNEKSLKILKGSFTVIKKNFIEAVKKNKVIPRFPYIPGYTDDMENINNILEIISEYKIKEIHILPYHNYGISKYEMLGRTYELQNIKIPEKKKMEKIKEYIENKGFKVIIGG
ncbi:MAG: [formate-C-acetyltransferase]-activating enzyme, partial [Leptotrichiaceae bacterium]|nr:[formate-C-acetyltransferase]-activating enzyme [Leptotrichiaceae bacterium]